jgi:hypothetical protein
MEPRILDSPAGEGARPVRPVRTEGTRSPGERDRATGASRPGTRLPPPGPFAPRRRRRRSLRRLHPEGVGQAGVRGLLSRQRRTIVLLALGLAAVIGFIALAIGTSGPAPTEEPLGGGSEVPLEAPATPAAGKQKGSGP